MEFSDVFWANKNCTADIAINQGGTDSGKTYAIMQLLFIIACTDHEPCENKVITIVSDTIPDSKKGPYRIAQSLKNDPWIDSNIIDWNRTDRVFTFRGGFIMEFVSYVDEQSAKQGKRQYVFFNEAQAIEWLIFWQAAKRTRVRTFIDYNPSARFWAHDNLIGTDPSSNDLSATVQLIISDHRHNGFLSEDDHRKTEGIKDPELWRVYARGMTGNVTGLIYPNWTKIPDELFFSLFLNQDGPDKGKPNGLPSFGGLDFGYVNDPTAGVKMVRIGESIYIHELCYTPAITPINTKQIFYSNGFNDGSPVYCEHDPDIVSQLRRLDMLALPARKGPGSIKAGIAKVNEYKIFYTASSVNINNERSRYMWLKDENGKSTNEPIGMWNHLMDAIRYGIYTHFYQQ